MNMTARTSEDPHSQGDLLPMSTAATCLARIGRIHSHIAPASFFRFAGQFAEKFRPRGISNALSQTMVMGHALDMQVFYRNDPKVMNNLAAFLMGEIIPSELNPFMNPRHNLAMLASLRRPLSQLGMLALDSGKSLFLFAKETRVSYLFTCREGRKGLESDIYSYLRRVLRQAKMLTRTRKRDVPFAGRGTLHRTGFHLALDRTVIDHLDTANLGEAYSVIMRDAETRLWEREGVVSAFALETGIARVLRLFSHSTEKGFKRKVNPHGDVLQDLRMHGLEGRPFLLQNRERVLLLKTGERDPIAFIGRLTHVQQVVIEPATLFQ